MAHWVMRSRPDYNSADGRVRAMQRVLGPFQRQDEAQEKANWLEAQRHEYVVRTQDPAERDFYFFAISDDIIAEFPSHGIAATITTPPEPARTWLATHGIDHPRG